MANYRLLTSFLSWERTRTFLEKEKIFRNVFLEVFNRIGSLGALQDMDYLERRKLKIFNLLVFFQLIAIAILPLEVIVNKSLRPVISLEMMLPAFINLLVLWLNSTHRYDAARLFYFMVAPIVTGLVYVGGIDLGSELNFVLYAVLAVFFIGNFGEMIFSVALSIMSYFMLSFVLTNYQYELQTASFPLYLFNQAVTLLFIFYGLFIIKKENTTYQRRLLKKGRMLRWKNGEIQLQKQEIEAKAILLEKQTEKLSESDAIKNKLFSVIAHDLRTPMYALRNLFRNIHDKNLSQKDIISMMPDVMEDLNHTTGLIENLLHWAKSQMNSNAIRPRSLDMCRITAEVLQVLRLQAQAKNIRIENQLLYPLQIIADNDMVHLVLRNLISNAIKFTPEKGMIRIGFNEMPGYLEVFVHDNGVGMSRENLQKIRENVFFTTKGTVNESGTGLGLMLCREFVLKNGGHIYIESEQGKGTTISFTLPRGDELLKAV